MAKRKAKGPKTTLVFQVKAHLSPATFETYHVAAENDEEARKKGVDLYQTDRDRPPMFCEIKLLFRLDA